jgi:CheY-like chemotaxis protein
LTGQAESRSAESLLVLAVDDDALIQMSTVAMLEELGHRVLEATNGAEALEILCQNPAIDMVLTDFAMPEMTGRDLAIAVARDRPGLPVILATGYAELPPGEKIDVRLLPKPFGLTELARALKR